MDFQLTDAQRLARDTARDFVDRELIPHVREWEALGEIPGSFYAKMAALGFLGAPVPEAYGGAGMDYVSFMLLVEEISRGSSSVRTTVSVQTSLSETSLMWFGTEAHKRTWLVPLAKGEISKEDVNAEIGQIVAGLKPARQGDDQITVFCSTGLAIQDCLTAKIAYDAAIVQKIGRYMQIVL